MDLIEPIHLDGKAYSKEALQEFCRQSLNDPAQARWKKGVFHFIAGLLDPEVMEFEQKTSGTTGDPKLHRLKKEAMELSARRTLEYFRLLPGEKALLCLPIHYVAGKMMVVRALLGGLHLQLAEPSSRPLRGWSNPVRFAAMVPLQVYESLAHGDDLSSVSILLVGGGEIHPALRRELEGISSVEIYESFAMTETYTHFAVRKIMKGAPGNQFRLLPGTSIELDSRGCLVVEMPGITGEPVHTNDLVDISDDGKGFHWLGRFDHVIKTGGVKVIPELLEHRIGNKLGYDCLVISESDPRLGERLVLVVECPDPDPPVTEWENAFREYLTRYEMPKRILILDEIPRNFSFKYDRKAVRALL
jgi:O-succinylbenzoic acid--CoA ligase